MKIDNRTFENMLKDIKAILPYYLVRKQTELSEITIGTMYDIWFYVHANRTWDSRDVRIFRTELGERVLSFNRDFDYYPCDTNDDTLGTALKKIMNQIKQTA
jgi:hypothetical protein